MLSKRLFVPLGVLAILLVGCGKSQDRFSQVGDALAGVDSSRQTPPPKAKPTYRFRPAATTVSAESRYVARFASERLGVVTPREIPFERPYSSLAFQSDDVLIAAETGAFTLIDLREGKVIRRDRVPNGDYIRKLAASSDGTLCVAGWRTKTLLRWDADGEVTPVSFDEQSVKACGVSIHGEPHAISPDKKTLLYLDDHRHERGWFTPHVVLCDLESGQVRTLSIDGLAPEVPEDADKSRIDTSPEGFEFTHAFFTNDGRQVVGIGYWSNVARSTTLVRFDSASGALLGNQVMEAAPTQSAATSIGTHAIATVDQLGERIQVWNAGDLTKEWSFPSPATQVVEVALSDDGQYLAAIDSQGRVFLWNLGLDQYRLLGAHGEPGLAALFSRDGQRLITTAKDNRMMVWKVADIDWTDKPHATAVAPDARSLALSPSGKYIGVLESDFVRVWDAKTGEGEFEREIANATGLAFSGNDELVVVSQTKTKERRPRELQELTVIVPSNGSTRSVRVPDPSPPKFPERFAKVAVGNAYIHGSPASVELSHDGSFAALIRPGFAQRVDWSGSMRESHCVSNINWNALTGTMHSQGFAAVAINGDGALVAGVTRNILLVQRVATGQTLVRIGLPFRSERGASLSFAPDGSKLVCQSDDWACVYDVRNASEVCRIEDVSAAVWFANSKDRVLLGKTNGDVVLFDAADKQESKLLSTNQPIASLCVDRKGGIGVLNGAGAVSLYEPASGEEHPAWKWETVADRDFEPVEPGEVVPANVSFAQWRENFRTFIRGSNSTLQISRRKSPPDDFEVVRYESDGRRLDAWMYQPKTRKKLPGLVYLHGGYSLDAETIAEVRELTQEQFVILAPAFRGENGGRGDHETMCGEVDDAHAAIRWLAERPEVDPKRIYAFGHSLGGGVSALLSLREDVPIQNSGSCGGLYPASIFDEWGNDLPFENTPAERNARLLLGNLEHMQRPHFAFLGEEDPLTKMIEVQPDGTRLTLESVPGDHFTSFEESFKRYLAVIAQEPAATR